MTAAFSPFGHEVMLEAVRAELPGSERPPATAGSESWSDARWCEVVHVAEWHRLVSVLARDLGADGAAPGWVREQLDAATTEELVSAMPLAQARRQTAEALAAAGIPAMFLKGSALIQTTYPDPSWRPMDDVDVLVPEAAMAQATSALAELGYEPHSYAPRPADRHHDAKLVGVGGLATVELHRRMLLDVDPRRFDIDEVWGRARPAGALPGSVPAATDLLIHVAAHFLRGRVVRSQGALAQLRDIAWLAREGVDWERLVEVSRRFGVAERVAFAVGLAQRTGLVGDVAPLRGAVDLRAVERFAALRVLTDRPLAPLGSWPRGTAPRGLLTWSRRHLFDVPAGEVPDDPIAFEAATGTRGAGIVRLAAHLASDPARALEDRRAGRMLRGLDAGAGYDESDPFTRKLLRRVRAVRRLRDPRQAALLAEVGLLAPLVPLLMRLPMPVIDRVLSRRHRSFAVRSGLTDAQVASIVDLAQRVAHPVVRRGCVTRGVTLYWLLGDGTGATRLAFGMGGPADHFAGHCWLERGGEPHLEKVDPRERFPEQIALPLPR